VHVIWSEPQNLGQFSTGGDNAHMMDVIYRYVAELSKLSKIPIEQLTRKPRSDSTQ